MLPARFELSFAAIALAAAGCTSPRSPSADPPQPLGSSALHPERSSSADAPAPVADLSREQALIDGANVAQESSDLATARAKAAEAVNALLSRPDSERDVAWVGLLYSAGVAAYRAQDFQTAREAFERVLVVRTSTLPEDHPDLQKARRGLANALFYLGDFEGARALDERVLEVRTRTLPADHFDLAMARMNLGVTLKELGEFQAAQALLEQVLEVWTRTLAADHPDLQKARAALALTLWELGDRQGTRALEERVLEVRTRTLPADHFDLAMARMNLAVTLRELGEFQAAQALLEQVLEVWTRTLAADHPDLQKARVNQAITMKELGDHQGARALQERVLEVQTRTLPEDHSDLQWTRANLAVTLKELGDFQGARALEEMVLEARTRTLPRDHPAVVRARWDLAVTLSRLGDFNGARTLFESVLEVWTRTLPRDHPDLVRSSVDLGVTLWSLGDFQGARTLFESVLEVCTRTLHADHPDLQSVRASLAVTLRELGDFHGARALEEMVLEARTRTLPRDHPDLQWARANLAITMMKLGDLQGARALQEQALEVQTRTLPEDHGDLQWTRGNLAVTLKELGDFHGARALEEKVLEVRARTLPRDHPDLARARGDLAATLNGLGDFQGARMLFEDVLEVWTRILPQDHPDLQWVRASLAVTLRSLGDLQGARALHEQVLEVQTRTLYEDHPELARARLNLALTIAVESARASGTDGEEVDERERLRCADLVHALAESAARVARSATLSSSSREVEERCSSLRQELSITLSFAAGCGVFGPDPRLARDAFVLSETTRAGALATARIASLGRSDARCGALRDEIRSAGEDLARLVQSGAARDAYDEVVARRDRAQREIVEIARQSAGAADLFMEPDPAAISERLPEGAVLVAYRSYARWEIPSGETKERSTPSLCAFVLRRGAPLQLVDLGALSPVRAAVSDWRESIGAAEGRGIGVLAADADPATEARRSTRLAELVLSPLRDGIGDARRVVFVLDDVLNTVPIDALAASEAVTSPSSSAQSSSDATLLGDRHEVEVRSTVQEWIQPAAAPSSEGSLVALGGVAYSSLPHSRGLERTAETPAADSARAGSRATGISSLLRGGAWSEGFAPLPWTLAEARGIVELAAPGRAAEELVLLEGDEASRSSIENLAPTTRFLHLATHGWFAPESVKSWSDPDSPTGSSSSIAATESSAPGLGQRMSATERVKSSSPMLLCGLALAGANLPAGAVGRSPGLVTAEEISGWDLSNCELAVLSACDTNVGVRRAGQGVASLQKALHMAGARTVVTSLWKVPDEATKDLMLDFYRRIWVEMKPKATALWEAKRKLRDAVDESGRPRYSIRDWAAWVLTGDPN